MEFIKILSGPLIGALIGYCTNYIAVKMLFRPLKPVYIGKFQLPFTPGIIPKRKPALASAVGKAVGNSLLRAEDLEKILASDQMKETVAEGIVNSIADQMREKSVKDSIQELLPSPVYDEKKEKLVDYLVCRISGSVCEMDIGGLLAQKGGALVGESMGMLSMFLNEETIQKITGPIGEKVKEYIREDGQEVIRERVNAEIFHMEDKETGDLLEGHSLDSVKKMIKDIYGKMIEQNSASVMENFKIAEIVEEKIQNMDPAELEQLVMSVMKNELSMIVNLGALIGFVIGILNILF